MKNTMTTRMLSSAMITSNNQPEAAATLPQQCKCRQHARLPTAEGLRHHGMQESSGTVSYYSGCSIDNSIQQLLLVSKEPQLFSEQVTSCDAQMQGFGTASRRSGGTACKSYTL